MRTKFLSIDGRPWLAEDAGRGCNIYCQEERHWIEEEPYLPAEHGEKLWLFGRRYEVNQLRACVPELVLLEDPRADLPPVRVKAWLEVLDRVAWFDVTSTDTEGDPLEVGNSRYWMDDAGTVRASWSGVDSVGTPYRARSMWSALEGAWFTVS